MPIVFLSVLATLSMMLFSLTGCDQPSQKSESATRVDTHLVTATPSTFVGSARCQSCHAEEFTAWQSSHHALAMQPANPDTVLATFPATVGDATLHQNDNTFTATFKALGEVPAEHEITHTFGVAPLQQYLVDHGNGQLQTLRQSWDSRPSADGGQRWFLQYADEHIPPGDVLHWQGMAQNWNSMCADCHTTGFRKGYDPDSGTFSSTYAELGVGCESCHGPASAHAADPSLPLPGSLSLATAATQPDVCAPCHARRQQIAEGFTAGAALLDYYVPALLNPPLYHADGQIDDEVYVYGSFVASKMHTMGVTCSDCHEPHSATLKIPGDGVCLQCHSPTGNPRFPSLNLSTYTSAAHHQHAPDSAGARCVACHMPSKTYMGVDERHDHSLRIPRPDLTAANGVPNPCAQCHDSLTKMKPPISDHFATVFARSAASVEGELRTLATDVGQSAIVRATALFRIRESRIRESRIRGSTQAGVVRTFDVASRDTHGLVRYHSVAGLAQLNPQRRLGAFRRLLADPLKAVRINTAATAISVLNADEQAALQPALQSGLAEYMKANELNAERPESNVNLAMMHLAAGAPSKAEYQLQKALELNPQFVPALLNYADLLRLQNRDAQAEQYLLTAVEIRLPIPEADYAYAMWLVRNGPRQLALLHLRRAFENGGDNPQWAYAYSLALHNLGQSAAARQEARGIMRHLVKRTPSNQSYRALYEALTAPAD